MPGGPVPVPDTMPTPPVAGAPGVADPGVMQKLAAMMKNISAGIGAQTSAGPGPSTPGQVGQVRQLAPGAPGVNIPNQGITSSSAPPPGSALPSNDFIPNASPTNMSQEFFSKGARNANTIYGAVKGFTDVVNNFKQRKDQEIKKRAEILSRSLYDALGRGDENLINILLGGPDGQKNVKILEKAGIGVPPEIQKVEPPTPEEQGVHAGIKYAIAAKQSKAQEAQALAAQNAATVQQGVAQRMQDDPRLAGNVGLGTALTADEQRKRELVESELAISPVLQAKLTAAEQQSVKEQRLEYAKLHASIESEDKQLTYNLAARKLEEAARHDDAVLLRGLEQKRLSITYQYNKDRLDALAKAQEAKTKQSLNNSNKMLLENTQRYIDSSRDELAALRKIADPTPEILAAIDAKEKAIQMQQATFTDLQDRLNAQESLDALFGTEEQ